ncbi:aminopeptidase P family protein, partial [Candidatus Fermentibacterales bacterium]|nr:aminopeptidase P family protein [Candidatus Fermentibacterales bacterium]
MFSAQTFRDRRKRLLEKLGDNSLAIVPPSSSKPSSADGHHAYVPNKNLYYLTGISQPDTWLVMAAQPGQDPLEILFIDPYDPEYERWWGVRLSPEQASALSGVETCRTNDGVRSFIDRCLVRNQMGRVFVDFPVNGIQNGHSSTRLGLANEIFSAFPHLELGRLSPLIFAQRMIKEPAELDMIRGAVATANRAMKRAVRVLRPGMVEYEFEAELIYEFTRSGERDPAFHPIVAGGPRATYLHYPDNDQVVNDGEMLLVDFGAQNGLYNCDITRTFPVSGVYSQRQRQLMDLVIEVQEEAIRLLRPGIEHRQWNEEVNAFYRERLKERRIIETDEELERVYYHRIGHSLGLDTHDECLVSQPIEEGMVFTVEPGL